MPTLEARCRRCGETFNPQPDEVEGGQAVHGYRVSDDHTMCGGIADVVGEWSPAGDPEAEREASRKMLADRFDHHYQQAIELLAYRDECMTGPSDRTVAKAQVHATLANACANKEWDFQEGVYDAHLPTPNIHQVFKATLKGSVSGRDDRMASNPDMRRVPVPADLLILVKNSLRAGAVYPDARSDAEEIEGNSDRMLKLAEAVQKLLDA